MTLNSRGANFLNAMSFAMVFALLAFFAVKLRWNCDVFAFFAPWRFIRSWRYNEALDALSGWRARDD